jgi:hypothetical protein
MRSPRLDLRQSSLVRAERHWSKLGDRLSQADLSFLIEPVSWSGVSGQLPSCRQPVHYRLNQHLATRGKPALHSLLGEVHSLEQGIKARIGAVGVEERLVG